MVKNFDISIHMVIGPIWGEQLWLEGFLGFKPRVVKLKFTLD
jgi:hypothetical protein